MGATAKLTRLTAIIKRYPAEPPAGEKWQAIRNNSFAYRLLLPYVLLLLAFVLYPILTNFYLSLRADDLFPSVQNYQGIITNPTFWTVSLNTFIWTVGSVTLQFLVGLGLAMLLNQNFRGRAFFRAVILVLPWATPDIVVAVAWQWMYNDMYGVLNDVLVKLHLLPGYVPWLSDPNLAKVAVIVANTWKGFALSAMFYLAALQTVSVDLYEAADIDGAGVLRKFWSVTLPVIRPFITTTILLTIIWTINYFPLIYVMTGGGPAGATDTFVTHAYRTGFRFLDFSQSATISSITFFIILAVTLVYTLIVMGKEAKES